MKPSPALVAKGARIKRIKVCCFNKNPTAWFYNSCCMLENGHGISAMLYKVKHED
jgi:hypothetical protein